MLCFVVVMQSFIMNSHEVFIHIHQGCFAGTGAIVRLPQCQWSKPDGYGKISQCITTTKHSKAKTMCIFLGIYCSMKLNLSLQRYHRDMAIIYKLPGKTCNLFTPNLGPMHSTQYRGDDIDGLVQDCSNSSALTMVLLQSCTKPSIWI